MKATVLIRPKEGILDPQGEAVGDALREHSGTERQRARVSAGSSTSSSTPAALPEAEAALAAMSRDLLANPLIESFTIELEGEA